MRSRFNIYSLIAILIIFLHSSCATLPDQEDVLEESMNPTERAKIKEGSGYANSREISALIREAVGTSKEEKLKLFIKAEQSVTGSPLIAGNKVTLLVDGPQTYSAMFDAIRKAKDHIHLETFILSDDEIGQKFANLLIKKSKEGIKVRVIYDGIGSFSSSREYFERLRDAGVKVYEFHPVDPAGVIQFWRVGHRDHRKILIVDGKIAFTGGLNISGVYSRSPSESVKDKKKSGWRDTDVRIEGPAVAQLQKLFLEIWTKGKENNSDLLENERYFPHLDNKGDQLVRIVSSQGGKNEYRIYNSYIVAMSLAQDSIWVTQAYFSPNDQFIKTLEDAARRGVDVRIILQGITTHRMVLYSSQSHYEEMLKVGVKLYERTNRIQHAKTAVIDGFWSTVGSSNLDYLSFVHDNEANAVILGEKFGKQMQALFRKDLSEVHRINKKEWDERSFWEKAKEKFSRVFIYWF